MSKPRICSGGKNKNPGSENSSDFLFSKLRLYSTSLRFFYFFLFFFRCVGVETRNMCIKTRNTLHYTPDINTKRKPPPPLECRISLLLPNAILHNLKCYNNERDYHMASLRQGKRRLAHN